MGHSKTGYQWTGTDGVTELDLDTELAKKQSTLVSGTNIKKINGQSILGAGDLAISGGGGDLWQIFIRISGQAYSSMFGTFLPFEITLSPLVSAFVPQVDEMVTFEDLTSFLWSVAPNSPISVSGVTLARGIDGLVTSDLIPFQLVQKSPEVFNLEVNYYIADFGTGGKGSVFLDRLQAVNSNPSLPYFNLTYTAVKIQ